MNPRPLFALLAAVLAVAGQADDSRATEPSAPIPSGSVWDVNAWEPGSADSFWTKSTSSVVRLSPPRTDRRAPAETEATPPARTRPFSSRQTGK